MSRFYVGQTVFIVVARRIVEGQVVRTKKDSQSRFEYCAVEAVKEEERQRIFRRRFRYHPTVYQTVQEAGESFLTARERRARRFGFHPEPERAAAIAHPLTVAAETPKKELFE